MTTPYAEARTGMDRPLARRRWLRRRGWFLAAACALAAAFAVLLLDGLGRSSLAVRTERLTMSTVRQGAFRDFIPVSATVVPVRTHYLDVAEGGLVDSIHVEAGQFVIAGDPILRLANTDLLMDVMQREAEIAERSNDLRTTRLSMARNGLEIRRERLELGHEISRQRRLVEHNIELSREGLLARDELIEAREALDYLEQRLALTGEAQRQDSLFQQVQIDQLESSLRQMEANLEVVRRNLENLVVKAPVTGHLTSLTAQVGELKSRGQRLGQIDILDGFKARTRIDEHYVGRIARDLAGGGTVSDDTFEVRVDKVFPEIRDGRFQVDLVFVGVEPAGLRRGQTLHVDLSLGEATDAVLLETGGFFQETGGRWVYVVDASGQAARKRSVQLGRRNAAHYEVLAGLDPGERVITSSYASYGGAEELDLR